MIPKLFKNLVPLRLASMDMPALPEEIDHADTIRRDFLPSHLPPPYMLDVIRAFRVLRGAHVYVEVGTRDKGNLAWVSTLLAHNATIIDVDCETFESAEAALRRFITSDQKYHRITGDSVDTSTVELVQRALNGTLADGIFLDSSHMYDHTLQEVDLYYPLIKDNGFLFLHDAYWEGNVVHKGKCQALQQIDRVVPVFCVFMQEPVHRFLPRSEREDVWGGVGVILR